MRTAYGHIEPYSTFYFDVEPPHSLYVEQCGNPEAPPVIVLHGGPGGGCNPSMRRFFHPQQWRVILFDQRGCGRSEPLCSLQDNTTWDLVDDMERLRVHLGIDKWVLFGGSWGSTLALAYAQTHPNHVSGIILRAVFTVSDWEIEWFYGGGAGAMLPEAWNEFLTHLSPEERKAPLESYYARLTHEDDLIRSHAAQSWVAWENAAIRNRDRAAPRTLIPRASNRAERANKTQATQTPARATQSMQALARLECHYCHHDGFLDTPTQLLDNAPRLADIPTFIVQGRNDLVTPPITAWNLAQALPHAELTMVDGAGHSASDPGILDALVRHTDTMAKTLHHA